MTLVRNPAVAGTFYESDPAILSNDVQGYLNAVENVAATPPKAIIVPHAGYIYSAPIAAKAYTMLKPSKDIIKRVVVLGPCHRVGIAGMALTSADIYQTPLGAIKVDHSFDKTLLALPGVQVFDDTHIPEHSLEVQLPFLQIVITDFDFIPIVVGGNDAEHIARVLDAVWGDTETLIVISSDLSHYLNYTQAQTSDRATCLAIEQLDAKSIMDTQACGRFPIQGLLTCAKRRAMTVKTLDLRNSGDTAGSKDKVVGYGAWAFWEPQP